MAVAKKIEDNLQKYGDRAKQLEYIVNDNTYDIPDGYRNFLSDMRKSILSGRKMTDRMLSAINSGIWKYKQFRNKSPMEQQMDKKKKENILHKIAVVMKTLHECEYRPDYVWRTEEFLKSVASGVHKYGRLTPKQVIALNNMMVRFKKRKNKVNASK